MLFVMNNFIINEFGSIFKMYGFNQSGCLQEKIKIGRKFMRRILRRWSLLMNIWLKKESGMMIISSL